MRSPVSTRVFSAARVTPTPLTPTQEVVGAPRLHRPRRRMAALAAFAVAPLLLAACGSSASPSASSSASGGSGGSSPTIASAHTSALGTVLVNGSGQTVYEFVNSNGTQRACNSSCQIVWPPVTSGGSSVVAGSGLTGHLGTTGSSQQVTYNGAPLYTYAGDTAAGQTNGQGLKTFGGIWYALTPQGHVASASTAATSSGSTSSSKASGSGTTTTTNLYG